MLITSVLGAASQTKQKDPALSDALHDIFAKIDKQTLAELNAATITVLGSVGGTDAQIVADLAAALEQKYRLHILPVVERGSVQSLADVLFLKGADLAIVRPDVIDYIQS